MEAEVKSGREESVWGKTVRHRESLTLKPSLGLTHLYAAVAPVGHDDVPIGIHSYSGRGIELSVALAMRAKFEEELSVSTVHLVGEGARDWGPDFGQRARPWRVGQSSRENSQIFSLAQKFFPGIHTVSHCPDDGSLGEWYFQFLYSDTATTLLGQTISIPPSKLDTNRHIPGSVSGLPFIYKLQSIPVSRSGCSLLIVTTVSSTAPSE